jgi:hypothetical protein
MTPRVSNMYVYQLLNEVKQKTYNDKRSHLPLDVVHPALTTNDSSYSCMTKEACELEPIAPLRQGDGW